MTLAFAFVSVLNVASNRLFLDRMAPLDAGGRPSSRTATTSTTATTTATIVTTTIAVCINIGLIFTATAANIVAEDGSGKM